MTGDQFTPTNEKSNVDQINRAAKVIDSSFGAVPFVDDIFGHRATSAADNLTKDFFDAYKKDPSFAVKEWKEIKASIHQGDNLQLPSLDLVDAYVKDAEKNGVH